MECSSTRAGPWNIIGPVRPKGKGPHRPPLFAKGLTVLFPGNKLNNDCLLTTLSRTAPPTELAGGYRVGEEVYFTGGNFTFASPHEGNRLEYGKQGEVTGPHPREDDRLLVMFPGNRSSVGCRLTALSRTAPPVRSAA